MAPRRTWGPCLLSATKLPPWQSLLPAFSWCPRNAKLVMSNVLTMCMIRRNSFRQKVASVSIACSWTRSVRCTAFHRPKAMLASRFAWVFSCYMIFTPKFFGFPDTPMAHSCCIMLLSHCGEYPCECKKKYSRQSRQKVANIRRMGLRMQFATNRNDRKMIARHS